MRALKIDYDSGPIERRLFEYFTSAGLVTDHGRIVRVGQLWRSNDPRRFRIVRVLGFKFGEECMMVNVENVTSPHNTSAISLRAFTIGPRGWSLEKESPCPEPTSGKRLTRTPNA